MIIIMIFGIVYERKSPSGKRYIGQTIDDLEAFLIERYETNKK